MKESISSFLDQFCRRCEKGGIPYLVPSTGNIGPVAYILFLEESTRLCTDFRFVIREDRSLYYVKYLGSEGVRGNAKRVDGELGELTCPDWDATLSSYQAWLQDVEVLRGSRGAQSA